jgi:serine/threonine protein kinase
MPAQQMLTVISYLKLEQCSTVASRSLNNLGKGTFGVVLHCEDTQANQRSVAIKVIRAKLSFLAQAQSEIRLLEELGGIMQKRELHSQSIVLLEQHFMHAEHQCLVFERLHCSLYDRLTDGNFTGLPLSQIRTMGAQILDALDVLHSLPDPIIHADIKPDNVLCTCGNDAKLADFGSACWQSSYQLSTYIQSRFYRSPEVLMGLEFSTAIDIWSFACMLMTLYTGRVLFEGTSSETQLMSIRTLCGLPPASLVQRVKPETRRRLFGSADHDSIHGAAGRSTATAFQEDSKDSVSLCLALSDLCRRLVSGTKSAAELADENALIDVLAKMLVYDPARRPTPKEAAALPFFTGEAVPEVEFPPNYFGA